MIPTIDASLILLTYKGKVLLMLHESNPTVLTLDTWSFIGGKRGQDETFEETILREVEGEIRIKLDAIEFLSVISYDNTKKYLFHAKLTDENVNNIIREEGHLLQFFTLRELEKLTLANSTKQFISIHRGLLEKAQSN